MMTEYDEAISQVSAWITGIEHECLTFPKINILGGGDLKHMLLTDLERCVAEMRKTINPQKSRQVEAETPELQPF